VYDSNVGPYLALMEFEWIVRDRLLVLGMGYR